MLAVRNLTKIYPGVVALDNVSLDFAAGEVHALMGENGAGKSTLIKAVAGAIPFDKGSIEFDGESYDKMTPALSKKLGLAVIYQDINLVPALSVAENIYMRRKFGKLFALSELCKMAKSFFEEYGFDLDPAAPVMSLPSASQQLVEICKAMQNNARILILDEPTAALASDEVDRLFGIIAKLKARNVTIVYISHRLDEVFAITERVSILRDGKYAATLDTSKTSREELISLMVGRKLAGSFPKRTAEIGETVLEAKNLTGNSVMDISFLLKRGEILGMSGLVGSGRSETAELLAGSKKLGSGEIRVGGKKVNIHSPSDAIALGIGLIPEERKTAGCIMFNSVKFNITLSAIKKYCSFGIISGKRQRAIAEEYKRKLQIKAPSINSSVINLSGGNQQKVVVAKTLAADLDIIIFDEPTKGIDIGAKREIYELMRDMTKQGKSIIMISSDMEEILGMSDRIIVLYEGEISGELKKSEFSQENVLKLASGVVEGIA
ncbi:MAG: sugar ABC transporter ATP-binding protein [Clostridiales bacterium]|jgi:ABC-type sugar transport system ATPase subunit|nr:sugar ABC transporter ATP-binding protein [Clostridiales bacterium]